MRRVNLLLIGGSIAVYLSCWQNAAIAAKIDRSRIAKSLVAAPINIEGKIDNTTVGDLNSNYWMGGLAFRDLFKEGSIAGLAVGQPLIANEVGNTTQTNFEAFYNLPLNDRIRITPLIQVITNPGNRDAKGTIFAGTVRTVFSF